MKQKNDHTDLEPLAPMTTAERADLFARFYEAALQGGHEHNEASRAACAGLETFESIRASEDDLTVAARTVARIGKAAGERGAFMTMVNLYEACHQLTNERDGVKPEPNPQYQPATPRGGCDE